MEECLLQAYLFVGFPAVLHAMRLWREMAGEALPAEDPLADPPDPIGWERRGVELCRRVYGAAYGKLRRSVRRLHPALDRWMVEEGYGKVLSRPGLDPVRRELCIVALLGASGRGPQLHSHLRGALRVGAARREVEEALAIGLAGVTEDAEREWSWRLWERVVARAE